MKLTAVSVERLQAASSRQEIPDSLCTGLYLVVQPTGKKSWQVRYRHGGTHRRMTLATYPLLSLAEARQRAREALGAASEGRDPSAEVKAAKAPKPEDDRNRIGTLVEQFAKRHLDKLKSGTEVRRAFDLHVLPKWGDRPVHTIGKRDVVDLLDGLVDGGKPAAANKVRAHLSKFFNWCTERDIIATPPTLSVKAPAKNTVRERVLNDDELRWLWRASEEEPFPWGPMAQMLLLTGQRLNEVAQMADTEIEGLVWRLAPERTKNGRSHDVPLSKQVQEILSKIERVFDASGRIRFVFTTTGTTPVSGFSKGLDHIQRRMGAIGFAERGEPVEIPRWTWHDLRRTAATGMARIGTPVRVTEAVLNHVSGTGGGIVAVYQRHDYADEKRQALDAWAGFVMQLVQGNPDNVVRLAGGR
ncbi:tyrosine-type recombinase/integrase [Pseudogemmobacter faecipullorum]|uniref:Site-specific integrase n=1 Tax=Pseudogemmobacter faecipullorum TaxID=2755041 RepID=A0ABS8CJ82_9RHOB|nr:site-specific integrase [Pseudogemmobacter faecipullorum]MCB5409444.1 site-specific integrase [Pseudogemmobacter faecipullorum]